MQDSSLSLAGSLLIAHPSLLDPNFRRTVLFVSANDPEDGSFGLILNRPSGRTVADVLPEKELGNLARIPVFLGGPVSMDQLIFAAFRWHPETQRMECRHHLLIEDAREAAHDDHQVVRAFIGYAGWSKGQLEGEVAQKAWVLQPPRQEILHAEQSDGMWRDITASLGPWFRLVAEAPEDPTMN